MRFQTLTPDATIRAQALANLEQFRTSLTERQAESLDATDSSPRAAVAHRNNFYDPIEKLTHDEALTRFGIEREQLRQSNDTFSKVLSRDFTAVGISEEIATILSAANDLSFRHSALLAFLEALPLKTSVACSLLA